MMTFFTGPRRCFFAVLRLGELAGRFDDNLRAHRFPIQLGGIFFGEDLDVLAIDADGIVGGGDLVRQVAEDGVVLQKMRQRLGAGEVVDGDEFQISGR